MALLCLLVGLGSSQAGVISELSFTQVQAQFRSGHAFQSSPFTFNNPSPVKFGLVGALDVPSLSIRGTYGFYDGATPVTAPGPVSGPLSLRFTEATIACSGGTGFCSPFTLDFFAGFGIVTFEKLPTVPTYFGWEGTTNIADPIPVSFGFGNATNSIHANLTPSFSTVITRPNVSLGTFGNNLLLMFSVSISSLPTGATISLPNSLWYSFEQSASDVPEPGTIGLAAAVLAGIYWIRRQRAGTRG